MTIGIALFGKRTAKMFKTSLFKKLPYSLIVQKEVTPCYCQTVQLVYMEVKVHLQLKIRNFHNFYLLFDCTIHEVHKFFKNRSGTIFNDF